MTTAAGTTDDGGDSLLASVRKFVANDVRSALPSLVVNGLIWVTPGWIGYRELVFLAASLGTAVMWVIAEAYWAGYRLHRPVVQVE
ncbi:MAG: hypothetical protein ABEI11_04440 [Haloarculaceae archaeon]